MAGNFAGVVFQGCVVGALAASAGGQVMVAESARDIPLAASVDVIVVGGTSGAVAASVAAAKAGASVHLIAPETYLGQDIAGTLRLWLEPNERPVGELARRVYSDAPVSDSPRLAFKYQADKPPDAKHKDTDPPSRLSDARSPGDPRHDSVQYNQDVTITADLGAPQTVREVRLLSFTREADYQVGDVAVEISDDTKQWKPLGPCRHKDDQNLRTTSVAAEAKFRYARLTVKKAPQAQRLLLGAIQFVPADGAAEAPPPGPGLYRPLHAKKTLEDALLAANVAFLYGCYASDLLVDKRGLPCGVVMTNRAGRQAILGKVIVDATDCAVVARLAGARLGEFKPGPQTVRWVVIAEKPRSGPGLTVRELPMPVTVSDMKGAAASGRKASWFEYTLNVDLAEDSWPARARLEQAVRDRTYDPTQLYAADVPWYVPPCAVQGRKAAQDWPGAGALDLDVCRPAGIERIWVLSGCADVPRTQAEHLLRPAAMMELGARLGEAAAQEAKRLGAPEGARVFAQSPGAGQGGQVRELLAGLRPLPAAAKAPQEARGLAVLGTYDVVVVGGGTAGAPAGIGAARQGARTLVVEYLHGLGGVGTLGMIGKYWYGNRVGFTATVPANPTEVRMEFYRSELRKAGADIWYGAIGCGSVVEGNRVTGVVVATPCGRGVVLGKVVIDGTGNADLAAAAGAETQFVQDNFVVQQAHIPPREVGAFYINGDRPAIDAADPLHVTQAMLTRKRAFDWGQIIDSRERRRIVGDYVLDWLDQINGRRFPDSIVLSTSDYDSHGSQIHPYFMLRPARIPGDPRHMFRGYTPYRCLLPKGLEGILVVGLGVSAHRDALPIIRMQPDLHNQGYAAGVAGAMAVRAGVAPRHIDVKALQRHLVGVGNLSADVLDDRDSYPMSRQKVEAAVAGLSDEYKGLEVALAQPEDALPLIRKAYDAATGQAKLAYAHVLGVMGDGHGLEVLLAEAQRMLKEPRLPAAAAKGSIDDVARLAWALGGTADPRAVPVLCAMAGRIEDVDPLRLRAISVSLGRIGDPAAAATLAQLTTGRAKEGGTGELIAACALYRCGDRENLARSTLERIVRGPDGVSARLAWQVLSSKPASTSSPAAIGDRR